MSGEIVWDYLTVTYLDSYRDATLVDPLCCAEREGGPSA